MVVIGMVTGRSGIVIDQEYLRHFAGEDHPERPERIRALLDFAGALDPQHFELLPPRPATRAEIELCHASDYVALVESTSRSNRFALDGDTITCRDSFAVAMLAVGGFLRLLDAIAADEVANGFALIRPPGHHAMSNHAMGFCLFNTIAIGARYLQLTYAAKRILIVDWDVHHGNGTQAAFYDDPAVLFISTHQFPFYPGTGAIDEIGANAGEGYTINVPLPAGCADPEYLRVFADVIVPAAKRFEPDWILVSAGFDPHRRDPLGGMRVTESGFAAMAQSLVELTGDSVRSRIAFLLEGGYDLAALRASVAAVLEVLQQTQLHDLGAPAGDRIAPLIRRIHQVHERFR